MSNKGLFVRGRAYDSSLGGKNRSRSKSRVSNKVKTCHYCKLKGHIKKDCWKLKRIQKESGSKDSTSRGASYVFESYDGGALVVTPRNGVLIPVVLFI